MYSFIRPPSTGFRRIRSLSTSIMVARGASRSSLGTLSFFSPRFHVLFFRCRLSNGSQASVTLTRRRR